MWSPSLWGHMTAARPAALLVMGVASACAPSAVTPSSETAVAKGSAAWRSPSPASTVAAIPDELLGRWQAVISTGEHVTLTLGRGSYQVRRGAATGAGSIAADRNIITFRSPLCDLGPGNYEWTVEGTTLAFVPREPRDPCGGRIIFLKDTTYTRVE
ncbi:MAG: hypothetical protein M3Y88_03900 [Chloroflexota bacterium]|nr:hypothetical protein [Chloroflexota bacterium]